MAVILSPKTWPDSTALGALASVIASHLYCGAGRQKQHQQQVPLQQGDSRTNWVTQFACSTS
jgi:hypothetical protein